MARRGVIVGSRVALVAGALAATVWRAPQYFDAPSFWAEEGTLFFARAWNEGPLAGLTQHPGGYVDLYPNLVTTLAASLVRSGICPLAVAPRVTVLGALAVQLLPIALLAAAASPAWDGPWRRAAAIAAVLFPARTGGLWLNTINSQFFLALAVIVILLEPTAVGRVRRGVYASVLALAGLTGPVSSFVAPLFVWKAWRARTRTSITLAAVSVACAVVQVTCVLVALRQSPAASGRGGGLTLGVLAAVAWMRTVVLPMLGPDAALAFGLRARPLVLGAFFVAPDRLFGLLLLVALVALVALLALGVPKEVRWQLAGSYAVVTVLSLANALGTVGAMLGTIESNARYALVPGVLMLWLVLQNVRAPRSVRSVACAALFTIAIATSAWSWRSTMRWSPSWPAWRAQVAAWEADAHRPLDIWPRGWKMQLAPRR
jgi:hypothetical protein